MRQINSSAYDWVILIFEHEKKAGFGGCFSSGKLMILYLGTSEIVKFGIAVLGGINGICVLEKTWI
jgi:HTH-type transcriptional regulator, global nitrogen regulator NrpRI